VSERFLFEKYGWANIIPTGEFSSNVSWNFEDHPFLDGIIRIVHEERGPRYSESASPGLRSPLPRCDDPQCFEEFPVLTNVIQKKKSPTSPKQCGYSLPTRIPNH